MDRIEKLERDLRNTRRAGIALVGLVLAGGFAAGWASKQPTDGVFDEIVAKKLRIVDDQGRDAIVGQFIPDGGVSLSVRDPSSGYGGVGMVHNSDQFAGLMANLYDDADNAVTSVLVGCDASIANITATSSTWGTTGITQEHDKAGGITHLPKSR